MPCRNEKVNLYDAVRKHLMLTPLKWRLRPWLLSADSRDARVADALGLLAERSNNPLTAKPRKFWSQADEDGILESILERIGHLDSGVFLELGVGSGSENNTLALLARGWKGGWLGGEKLCFQPQAGGRLQFRRSWLTLENVIDESRSVLQPHSFADCDVVSVDLDGNDFHIVNRLLEAGLRPKVWVAEYNSAFPCGAHWTMPYDAAHKWSRDDYYGASFSSFSDLFRSSGYLPVACSVQGANLFAVRDDYRAEFADVPKDDRDLFQPGLYFSLPKWGHRPSTRTLQSLTAPNRHHTRSSNKT